MSELVKVPFKFEFPLCICPHCDQKWVLIGVVGQEEDEIFWMNQVNTNKAGMYCPYCGKNSND